MSIEATWGCQCATCEKLRRLDSAPQTIRVKCFICGAVLPAPNGGYFNHRCLSGGTTCQSEK
jgi:ribosomal protein S27E